MTILEIIILSIGLAMDAFAVAVCKGLSIKKITVKAMIIVGFYFGFFQGAMPLISYYLGKQFENWLSDISQIIAFVLMLIIGIHMIYESMSKKMECANSSLKVKAMLPLAFATSVDALAVGVTLAMVNANIYISIAFISSITFIISIIGLKIGNLFGCKYKRPAEFIGGVILILIGLRILIGI